MEILDRGDLNAIIDWMPHGRAFIVRQPKIFQVQILPRFFKQTKFLSFTRQLNLWGFKRITQGLDSGAYYHKLFLPGHPNLAMRMTRQKIKGKGIRSNPSLVTEPNFYYDYPHVARVPRSGSPIPLPPLPSERTADLTGGGEMPDRTAFLGHAAVQQHQQVQLVLNQGHQQAFGWGSTQPPSQQLGGFASLVGSQDALSARFMGRGVGIGLPSCVNELSSIAPSENAMNVAAAAKYHIQASTEPGLATSSSSSSKMMAVNNNSLRSTIPIARPEAFAPASPLDLTPNVRQASMNDVAANANRRLMERLLDQTAITPTPLDMIGHHSLLTGSRYAYQSNEASAPATRDCVIRHHNLIREVASRCLPYETNEAILLGQESSITNPQSAPSREIFKFEQQSNPRYPLPTEFRIYSNEPCGITSAGASSAPVASMPPSSAFWTPSAGGTRDISDIANLTNALREAQHFEDLARSQRAAARAMAGAMKRRMDLTSPLGRDFRFEDVREGEM